MGLAFFWLVDDAKNQRRHAKRDQFTVLFGALPKYPGALCLAARARLHRTTSQVYVLLSYEDLRILFYNYLTFSRNFGCGPSANASRKFQRPEPTEAA